MIRRVSDIDLQGMANLDRPDEQRVALTLTFSDGDHEEVTVLLKPDHAAWVRQTIGRVLVDLAAAGPVVGVAMISRGVL